MDERTPWKIASAAPAASPIKLRRSVREEDVDSKDGAGEL